MKQLFFLVVFCSSFCFAQEIEPIEIVGTNLIVVPFSDIKLPTEEESGIKIINTETGEIYKEVLPKGTYIQQLEHVKIDALGISEIVILTKIERLNKGIFSSESRLIIYNSLGKLEKSTMLDKSIGSQFLVNKLTGRIVVIAFPSHEASTKRTQQEIIYDLKTNSLILVR